MKSLNSILFYSILFLIVTSCSKDDEIINEKLHNISTESVDQDNSSIPITLSSYYSDKEIEIKKKKRIVTPPYELQQEIYLKLIATDNWDINKQILSDAYGKIRWNWSLIYMKSSEEYVVTIPVYDKSKLTGMLLYMDNGEYNKFEFESVNDIMNKTDNFRNNDVDDLMFIFVQGFIRMHEVQYADQHKSANDWIIHQIKNKNLTSNFKNSCGEFCFDATEIDREPDKYSSTGWSAVIINVEKCIPIDCPPNIDAGPSAPSGGLIITIEVDNNSTGGSSDGDGNDDGDNDNKPEPKIKDKECEENNMTSEAVDCINSSNLIFPCEEGTTEDVWDDIVNSLCNNASDGQNSQLEGPQPGQIDCTDVDVEVGSYGGIDLSGLDDCPYLKCVMEDFVSSNNDTYLCNIIDTLDSASNFTYEFFVGDYPKLITRPRPETSTGDERYNYIRTFIPEEMCENSDALTQNEKLELSLKLIHETLHASFLQKVYDHPNFPNIPKESTFLTDNNIWAQIAESLFGETGNGNHHFLFYEYMLDIVTVSLWEINGMQGPLENYQYAAHIFINTSQMAETAHQLEQYNLNHPNGPTHPSIPPWLGTLGLENFDLMNFEHGWNGILTEYGFAFTSCY